MVFKYFFYHIPGNDKSVTFRIDDYTLEIGIAQIGYDIAEWPWIEFDILKIISKLSAFISACEKWNPESV